MKNPKCRHADYSVMVTNSPEGLRPTGPHASVRVCYRRGCVLDAMSIILLGTGMSPWWRRDGGEWFQTPPTGEETP